MPASDVQVAMTANADELRAHMLVVIDHAQAALSALGGSASSGSLILPPHSEACAHPVTQRTYSMGGHWRCTCGATGKDTDE